jgi:hypothetical protein
LQTGPSEEAAAVAVGEAAEIFDAAAVGSSPAVGAAVAAEEAVAGAEGVAGVEEVPAAVSSPGPQAVVVVASRTAAARAPRAPPLRIRAAVGTAMMIPPLA